MPATKIDGNAPTRKDKFELAVSRLSDLPTIPNTLLRIWQLVDDPDSSASDLEKVITMDQALSAKIIRLVNSPYSGIKQSVSSCRQAVTLLGFETVKNLSVCGSVVSACLPKDRVGSEIDLEALWKHSVATGVTARLIATRVGLEESEAAFTAGVLHDIGKFVMNLAQRRDYGEAIRLANTGNMFICEAERSVFDADHQYFGGFLARMWGFPELLVEAIETHHCAPTVENPMAFFEVISLADTVARILRVGSSGDVVMVERDADTLAAIGLTGENADRFFAEARQNVDDASDLFGLLD